MCPGKGLRWWPVLSASAPGAKRASLRKPVNLCCPPKPRHAVSARRCAASLP
jgi:hypothetical protein